MASTNPQPVLYGPQGCQGSKTGHRALEEVAYCDFFRRYQPPVFGLARNRGLSRHDAEDVVQEVMLAAWRHLNGTVAQGCCDRFRGLVLRIAGNKVVDSVRRRKARPESKSLVETGGECLNAGEPVDGGPGPAALYERKDQLAELAESLERCRGVLAPRTFRTFRLYVLQDVPAAQAAATVEMPVNQVYVTRHQLIDRLRRLML